MRQMDVKIMIPEDIIREVDAWAREVRAPEAQVAEVLGVSIVTWRAWKSALRGATLPRFTRDSLVKLRAWKRPEVQA